MLQARAIKRQQDENENGGDRYAAPSGHGSPGGNGGKPVMVSDSYMLDKLEAEGWGERG